MCRRQGHRTSRAYLLKLPGEVPMSYFYAWSVTYDHAYAPMAIPPSTLKQ